MKNPTGYKMKIIINYLFGDLLILKTNYTTLRLSNKCEDYGHYMLSSPSFIL